MAEPHSRAPRARTVRSQTVSSHTGRPRQGRQHRSRTGRITIALLLGAMITFVVTGLFLTGSAQAATNAPVSATAVSQTAHTDSATQADRAGQNAEPEQTAAPDGGVCSVPGIGDIGGLLGLCSAGSGTIGDLNNICTPSVQTPDQATSGVNEMIAPPGGTTNGKTLYDNYGMAGLDWNAYGLQCSDMTSLIGNNVAGIVFDMAKSLDRVTITVYQAAAGNGILTWLQNAADGLITAIGNAIFFPWLGVAVIIGTLWLAYQGLVRKRATRSVQGTLWMVVAAFAAIWLIGQPSTFTGMGASVSNGVTQVLDTAFARLPAPSGSNCVPVSSGDQQSVSADYSFTSASGLVDQDANELWSVLACKPWLIGELGTSTYAASPTGTQTVVNKYGRQLLWSQAVAANEQPTQAMITAKQDTYVGIAKQLQSSYPAVYPLFQGNQWTTRLEIAFAALFAALAAGLLILLISLTLIVLKLGWLLLLIVGPLFLIIGIHPGFGRVIALRWFEMLIGILLKQIAIALVLSILLYCYSLIMGTTDSVLPWAFKILMIALVTVAAYIYRKPFTHLFSSVGYGMIGSTERAVSSYEAAEGSFRTVTRTATTLPGVAAVRAARWARRNQVPGEGTATTAAAADTAAGAQAPERGGTGDSGGSGYSGRAAARVRADGATASGDGPASGDGTASGSGPAPGGGTASRGGSGVSTSRGSGSASGAGSDGGRTSSGGGGSTARHSPQRSDSLGAASRSAPPLPLPEKERGTSNGGSSAGWARNTAGWSGAGGGATGRSGGSASGAPSRPSAPSRSSAPPPSANADQGKTPTRTSPPQRSRATGGGGGSGSSGRGGGDAADGGRSGPWFTNSGKSGDSSSPRPWFLPRNRDRK